MKSTKAKLQIRNATAADIDALVELSKRVYPVETPYTRGMIRGHINTFARGQFVATYEGKVVGYAATLRVKERKAFGQHDWIQITGGGYGSTHDGNGDWLYGFEVMVDPSRRRLRIGKRLYDARQALCVELDLKGIVFAGRMAGYAKKRKQFPDPDEYLASVKRRETKDPTLDFQIRAGFEPERVMRLYNREDKPSDGHAALMLWRNPYYDPNLDNQPVTRLDPEVVRIVSVQMAARTLNDTEEFYKAVDYFVDVASEYEGDFVVFPELFTLQLLSCEPEELAPDKAIARLTEHTEEFVNRLRDMAVKRNVNIIGGSHPTIVEDGDIHNIAYVFLRDGSVHAQEKIHPTPDERTYWNIHGGDAVEAIETDCGPIGVMICYDSEFPELGRRLADQGARILFVPYNTDTRHGYWRVRYCCQARAIENQCYVVTSGMTGNLDNVSNLDIQWAESGIFTPSDFPFARDGIAALASENVEMVAVADLNLNSVTWARAKGSVRNMRDRRFDLYRTVWSDGG
ncbi:bifunctional GNAT family N-acetyltransferase/carbon-nitrogen hydrolase family protein [Notoacmeibacter ruber]|uniref:GNAT family N-acetyltransferase n=1 Tax=Notoacmeibacter ruber TaxID=2670375 RepID=A0A3L7JAY4_9HYPH|nr:bifunctional GNAT family N-acetyltransferase/carbon-nitrogen hydrolase family protein [Notoacmeibacter ruber]RLQ87614.1 GNAT family N-acetyltransferase [Notoacmeibacter ruber]